MRIFSIFDTVNEQVKIMQRKNKFRVITEMNVDKMFFQVTENPFEPDSYILWLMDTANSDMYTAIGKFSGFDKRKILNFIVKFITNNRLRDEIENKKFEIKIKAMTHTHISKIEHRSRYNKESAYRELFDLSSTIEKNNLAKRMKILAKRFHPDIGGDHKSMILINDAYNYLLKTAR